MKGNMKRPHLTEFSETEPVPLTVNIVLKILGFCYFLKCENGKTGLKIHFSQMLSGSFIASYTFYASHFFLNLWW